MQFLGLNSIITLFLAAFLALFLLHDKKVTLSGYPLAAYLGGAFALIVVAGAVSASGTGHHQPIHAAVNLCIAVIGSLAMVIFACLCRG